MTKQAHKKVLNAAARVISKGAFTLRAVRRSKAAPVCGPSAPHGAARRRAVGAARRRTALNYYAVRHAY